MAVQKPDLTQVKSFKPGSPEMEMLIANGYPDIGDREHAKLIIAEWEKDHTSHPYAEMKQAQAFLAALDAKVQVIDVNNPGVRNTRPR